MEKFIAIVIISTALYLAVAVKNNERTKCNDAEGNLGICRADCTCSNSSAEQSTCKNGKICCVTPCLPDIGSACMDASSNPGFCSRRSNCTIKGDKGNCDSGICCLDNTCPDGVGNACSSSGICVNSCGTNTTQQNSPTSPCNVGFVCCEPNA